MTLKKILARICFPDDTDERVKALIDLYLHYEETEGTSGETMVGIGIKDDELVIEVKKGFHCIFIPISDIKSLLEKEKE